MENAASDDNNNNKDVIIDIEDILIPYDNENESKKSLISDGNYIILYIKIKIKIKINEKIYIYIDIHSKTGLVLSPGEVIVEEISSDAMSYWYLCLCTCICVFPSICRTLVLTSNRLILIEKAKYSSGTEKISSMLSYRLKDLSYMCHGYSHKTGIYTYIFYI